MDCISNFHSMAKSLKGLLTFAKAFICNKRTGKGWQPFILQNEKLMSNVKISNAPKEWQ
jgi:hypothetical protein